MQKSKSSGKAVSYKSGTPNIQSALDILEIKYPRYLFTDVSENKFSLQT